MLILINAFWLCDRRCSTGRAKASTSCRQRQQDRGGSFRNATSASNATSLSFVAQRRPCTGRLSCHCCVPRLHRANHSPLSQQLDRWWLVAAGCGWPVGTSTWCLVPVLVVVPPASRCGVCCLPFLKPRLA